MPTAASSLTQRRFKNSPPALASVRLSQAVKRPLVCLHQRAFLLELDRTLGPLVQFNQLLNQYPCPIPVGLEAAAIHKRIRRNISALLA